MKLAAFNERFTTHNVSHDDFTMETAPDCTIKYYQIGKQINPFISLL